MGFKPVYRGENMNTDLSIYADTDSVTKQAINATYGWSKTTTRNYITVIVDDKPMVIFKNKIVGVQRNGERSIIFCTGELQFYTKNSYVDVVKMLI